MGDNAECLDWGIKHTWLPTVGDHLWCYDFITGKRKKKDVSTKKVAKKAKVEEPGDSDEDEDDDDDDDLDEADLDSDDSNVSLDTAWLLQILVFFTLLQICCLLWSLPAVILCYTSFP